MRGGERSSSPRAMASLVKAESLDLPLSSLRPQLRQGFGVEG